DVLRFRRRVDRLNRLLYHRDQVHRADGESELTADDAGSVEQVIDQTPLRLPAALDDIHRLLDLPGVQAAVAQQGRVSEYRVQWRAQLMRNDGEKFVLGAGRGLCRFARGPLAEEQFFALRLRLLARCDVLNVGDRVQRTALGVADDRPVHQRPDDCAVFPHVTLLNAVFFRPASEGRIQFDVASLAVVGISHVIESETEHFIFGVTQHLRVFAIDTEVSAFGRDQRHADGRQIEQRANFFLAPLQLLFDPPALGHVAQLCGEMRHFAALISYRPGGPFEINFRTILAVIDRLTVEDLARRAIFTQPADYGAISFGPLQDVRRFADHI